MTLTLIKEKMDINEMILQHSNDNDFLKLVSQEITNIDSIRVKLEAIRDFVEDEENGAAGLALVQIGVLFRAFAAKVMMKKDGKKQFITEVFINPKFKVMNSKPRKMAEGCLSLRDLSFEVRRPTSIFVSYTDLDGNKRTAILEGKSARVFLHENDHLNGVLISDIGIPILKQHDENETN